MENMEYDVLLEEFKKILKTSGLKYTKQRESLLKLLYNNDEHCTPDELYEALKEMDPNQNIGIATIYRTLNLLEESGMVTSISFGTAGKKFELANKPHHDHMICKSCNKIIEFQDDIVEQRQLKIAKEHGFKLSSHLMQLYGTCKECQKK
ncbi:MULTISPECIES: Fur family transcriptional regulator [unclassified Campylobacter]|uniref:Fur family transcriptional regulator n=1 Tax=unclassified Campylobacter TaxID=2593542 RepID=UPI001BD958FA|nr:MULTISPECIES: Fur family transcriptional regulator [unclassified Campylobacter]MBZ7975752.1 transcriptional repressor [Campylobacter sp. RM12637]MBZ7977985.1 transcriptional repressor [Campylobacter sp. RM12654]MBZ7979705.1 transcriptional repressor [Campylobacter sp. RM12642]MBZ7981505.1 transcriptional repressor [Campylobacter sp. RM12640]MBZ7983577.1 transcriptional repressor [Campylobacter sp. RM12647]MBZ7989070.1 transcriptional repressor [Campylobacter sp. RM12635]MBZ7990635.1 trans